MKKIIYKIFLFASISFGLTNCSDSFFDTEYRSGIGVDGGLESVANVKNALNGAYYNLYYYSFGGNYAVSIGDIATDLAYFNSATSHFNSIYTYGFTADDSYLKSIWEYGYKVVDNSARIIEAYGNIYDAQTETNKKDLTLYTAEAYGLRAISYLYMSNVYCLPYKVDNGTDNGAQLGLVIVDKPKSVTDKVYRSSIEDTYAAIVADLLKSIELFESINDGRGFEYMNQSAAYGFLARTYLYMQEYDKAIFAAEKSIALGTTQSIVTDAAQFKTMYTSLADGKESNFVIHVDGSNNLSANSPGTLWTKYGYMPSEMYGSYLAASDVRQLFMQRDASASNEQSTGAKYLGVNNNPAVATQRLLGLPELYLIIAEASLKKTSTDIPTAQNALLNVAKRNPAITSVTNLPSDKTNLLTFIEQERVRELIQEGHRFQDCRRWGKKISVYCTGGISFKYKDFDISKFCFPVPNAEIKTGAGVVQNPDWNKALPK